MANLDASRASARLCGCGSWSRRGFLRTVLAGAAASTATSLGAQLVPAASAQTMLSPEAALRALLLMADA